MSEKWKTDLS